MSAVHEIEQQLIGAILEWMQRECLTQEAAAARLHMSQSNLNGLLRHRRRHSLNRLLHALEAAGGWSYTFKIFRIDPKGDQPAISD